MEKQERYSLLVQKRKTCRLCTGLTNPAHQTCSRYDSDQIGPWSRWQGSLDADILVVGQDWGDTSYFNDWQGRDQASGNPTNENLQELLLHIGVHVGKPRETQPQVVFFTNLILCLKEGGLQSPADKEWFTNCSQAFFKPLVELISPKVVLALGKKTSHSILDVYGVPHKKTARLLDLMKKSPYRLSVTTVLFPLYHCGANGVKRNRRLIDQKSDWAKIAEWLGTSEKR
ncbi:MAG TPA: uracil-DNA glycosylase family protein [Gemmataceae bacterium]|jgi:DNA polymerase